MKKIQAVKGTRDILPEDQAVWEAVTYAAAKTAEVRGYERIDTPVFESASLFRRSVGEQTDIVNKEMYAFEPRPGKEEVVLRPEATASICRAYIQHGMQQWLKPVLLYYIGPMFRYENPQKGRWRQFHQFGAEMFGEPSPGIDCLCIVMGHSFLEALRIPRLVIKINTLGNRKDRDAYIETLRKYYAGKRLSDDARRRLERSPLRLLDAAEDNPELMELAESAPRIADEVGADARERFERVKRDLENLRIPFQEDHKLVRGLDYYNDTVFEIAQGDATGRQSTLLGGGRYDYLVEQLGGPPTPAVGFAAGLDRIVGLVQESPLITEIEPAKRLCLVYCEQADGWSDEERGRKSYLLANLLSAAANKKQFKGAAAKVAPGKFRKYARSVSKEMGAHFVVRIHPDKFVLEYVKEGEPKEFQYENQRIVEEAFKLADEIWGAKAPNP